MKVRNGFVSNSSSSSFILIFDKKPESKEEFAGLMGDCAVSGYGSDSMSADMVVDIAYDDMIDAGEASVEEIRSELSNHFYEWTPDHIKWKTPEYDEWQKKSDERIAAKTDQFLKANSSKYMSVISYGDDTTIGSMMEHQGAFSNLNHIQVSHH